MESLAYVFEDTQKRLLEDRRLYDLTSRAVMCTLLYAENITDTRVFGNYYTNIQVTNNTVLNEAERLSRIYPKVAVLNFANAVTPGGGSSYGEMSQESSLCRCSNLFPCLSKADNLVHFYQYNNERSPYYSNRIIYSENITVFKEENGYVKRQYDWFPIDVITCSAPNLRVRDRRIKRKKLEKILTERIRNILLSAQIHGVQALVLGAFGCGGFRNSPELVADIFEKLLVEGEFQSAFREVIFAIKVDNLGDKENFEIFTRKFNGEIPNPLWGKKVSIYGDSLSTYYGYNPPECKVYYTPKYAERNGIFSVDSTWWMIVLNQLGARLLTNHSWSGSKVYGNIDSSGSSEWRTKCLHQNGEIPDAILVSLGMNDFGNGIPVGKGYFQTAYEKMLWLLRCRYPDAEIYCATICPAAVNGRRAFPKRVKGNSLESYNAAIRKCAAAYGCRLIDLRKMNVMYETMDGCHPNVQGMYQLAIGWIQGLLTNSVSVEKKQGNLENKLIVVLIFLVIVLLVLLLILIFG